MSVLSKAYFHDEAEAFAYVESVIWPNGPVCPHCGGNERVYDLSKTRMGLRKCGHCRKQFTVRVGTVFESSHVPMHKWLQAIYLMSASKKGISAHQLHRVLEVTYKTAWFMEHRIREAMRSGDLAPMGGPGRACISTAPRSTCIGMSRSSSSVTTSARSQTGIGLMCC